MTGFCGIHKLQADAQVEERRQQERPGDAEEKRHGLMRAVGKAVLAENAAHLVGELRHEHRLERLSILLGAQGSMYNGQFESFTSLWLARVNMVEALFFRGVLSESGRSG